MLKRPNRLAKGKDIHRAFAKGRSFFNPIFTVKFVAGGDEPRFTVVVSTKVSKKAVARNRIKRLIREYLRLNLKNFKNGDHVIMAKPKAVDLPKEQLISKLIELFNKR